MSLRQPWYFSETFLPLLVALVGTLLIAPIVEFQAIFGLSIVSAVLLSGVFAAARTVRARSFATAGAALTLALKWRMHFWEDESPVLHLIAHLTMSGYMIFLWSLVLRRVISHPRITRDTVVGAVCGYLLIAFIFGSFYAALMTVRPDAFSGVGVASVHGQLDQIGPEAWTMIYFSFTPLTTLGFGDILPVLPMARSLTIMEVLAGQLYLAAFVARLVGGLASPQPNS